MPTIKRKGIERQIFDAANPLLMLPFNGVLLPFRIRKLTFAQVASLGNMSLIQTFHDKLGKGREPSALEMNEYAERQHELCKLAMVGPTYDEVIRQIAPDFDFKALESELAEIKRMFLRLKDGLEKKQLQDRYNLAELRYKFLLPADFIGAVLDFALEIEVSGIKLVTHEILLQAAVLAHRGHDNPADHIDTSLMTPFHVNDFNNRAWIEFDLEQDKNKKRA